MKNQEIKTPEQIAQDEEKEQKSRNRIFILLCILAAILIGLLVYEVIVLVK